MIFNEWAQFFIILGGLFEFFGCLGGVIFLYRVIKLELIKYHINKSVKEGLCRVFGDELEQS